MCLLLHFQIFCHSYWRLVCGTVLAVLMHKHWAIPWPMLLLCSNRHLSFHLALFLDTLTRHTQDTVVIVLGFLLAHSWEPYDCLFSSCLPVCTYPNIFRQVELRWFSFWLLHLLQHLCDWRWGLLCACELQPTHDLFCPEHELWPAVSI